MQPEHGSLRRAQLGGAEVLGRKVGKREATTLLAAERVGRQPDLYSR